MLLHLVLPKFCEFFYTNFKNKKLFLVVKQNNLYYITIPNFILLKKNKNFLNLFTKKNFKNFKTFFIYFSFWLKYIEKPFRKKLFLKGLGLKSFLIDNGTILELKLGFSHIINITIPLKQLKVKLLKNVILVEGSNFLEVTTFLDKIKKLKQPNIYKGKGLWYKNEIIKLKVIKKI